MYPFGSGMPQPTPPQNNHTHGMQSGAPFGGGWVTMPQSPQHSANGYPTSHSAGYAGYPPQNRGIAAPDAGYPSQNQGAAGVAAGYPSHASAQHAQYSQQRTSAHYPSQAPYLAAGGVPLYPTMKSNPYPGSSYPHNPQHPQQCPYPSSSSPGNNYQQQQAAAPYPSATTSHHNLYTSYPPTHGYQPISSVAGSGSPAVNMAHCFSEMTQRQNQSFAKKEIGFEEFSGEIDFNENGTPTVVPAPDFDPVKDAHDLKKAMKGFGTDEDTLINIICRRSNEQRQEIQRQYKTHFGKDLIEDIKSETSGNFEKLLVGLLLPIVDFYCTELCDAMAGIGTDEEVLVEVLCTLSNHEIHTIKNGYVRMYGAHLESELQSETSGNFKRLMVSLCTAARDESGHIDPVAAQNDARELLKAGELRVGTDESTFNMILCQRNYAQLKLIFQEYQNMTGHSLEKALKKEFSGDILAGLLAIYKCVTNKSEYFASRLHKSMAGIGTNDKQLVRVIVMRSEIDMQDIKTAFERMYGKSLKSWIKGDTSGHYKHALYALIGEQRSS